MDGIEALSLRSHDDQLKDQHKKIEEFSSVLDTLDNLEDKKKLLWMHIYEHAVQDRTHAYMLFTELYVNSKGQPSEHHLNGPILAKYIERMSRANDQLLKLAELVQKAQDEEEAINEDDVYRQIQDGMKGPTK